MTGRVWAPPGGWLIYCIRFFSFGTWGALYPFLAVWLIDGGSLPGARAGMVAATAVIANRIGAMAFVRLVRRHDKRSVVLCAQAAMIAALASMSSLSLAGARSLALWLLVAIAFGAASSVATLAQLALIVGQFAADEARRAFSCENVALNIAAGVTPLVSALAVTSWPRCYPLTPLLFCLVGLVLTIRLPRGSDRCGQPGTPPEPACAALQPREPVPPDLAGERSAVRRGAGWAAAALLPICFLTTVAYAQFYGVFPAYATPHLGERRVGLLLASSSVAIVALQAVVTRLSGKVRDTTLIVASNLFLAGGTVLLLRGSADVALALVAVLVLTLGEMVYVPVYQALAVAASGGRAEFGLGVMTFVWGVAESLAVAAGLALVGAGRGGLSLAVGSGCGLAAAVAAAACRGYLAWLGRPTLHAPPTPAWTGPDSASSAG